MRQVIGQTTSHCAALSEKYDSWDEEDANRDFCESRGHRSQVAKGIFHHEKSYVVTVLPFSPNHHEKRKCYMRKLTHTRAGEEISVIASSTDFMNDSQSRES